MTTSRWCGWFLAVWSGGFAAVHVAWALGWRAGVPTTVPAITDRPVFLAYDVLAAVLMLAAAYVAVRLTRPLDPATRRRLVRLTLAGAVLALLRGVPALALDLGAWVSGERLSGLGPVADTWFVVAGLAGLLLAHLAGRVGVAAGPGLERVLV